MDELLSPVSGASKKETIFMWVVSIVLTLLFVHHWNCCAGLPCSEYLNRNNLLSA